MCATAINTSAIREKQSLQLFTPCISAHTVWGLCWYNSPVLLLFIPPPPAFAGVLHKRFPQILVLLVNGRTFASFIMTIMLNHKNVVTMMLMTMMMMMVMMLMAIVMVLMVVTVMVMVMLV